MKLFAWQPHGHGPLSFFVAAESETDARRAVENYLSEHLGKEDGHYISQSQIDDWKDNDSRLTVLDPGQVIVNWND